MDKNQRSKVKILILPRLVVRPATSRYRIFSWNHSLSKLTILLMKCELLDDNHLTLGKSKLFFACGLVWCDNSSQLQLLPRFILELFKLYFVMKHLISVLILISLKTLSNSQITAFLCSRRYFWANIQVSLQTFFFSFLAALEATFCMRVKSRKLIIAI